MILSSVVLILRFNVSLYMHGFQPVNIERKTGAGHWLTSENNQIFASLDVKVNFLAQKEYL